MCLLFGLCSMLWPIEKITWSYYLFVNEFSSSTIRLISYCKCHFTSSWVINRATELIFFLMNMIDSFSFDSFTNECIHKRNSGIFLLPGCGLLNGQSNTPKPLELYEQINRNETVSILLHRWWWRWREKDGGRARCVCVCMVLLSTWANEFGTPLACRFNAMRSCDRRIFNFDCYLIFLNERNRNMSANEHNENSIIFCR